MCSNINKKKEVLREKYKKIRKFLNKKKLFKVSLDICHKIYKTLKPFKFKSIMLYYPLSGEINVKPLFYYFKRKQRFFPRTLKSLLLPIKVKNLKHLKRGKFKIFEPSKNFAKMLIPDIVIVPGLVFDKKGYRLGFGKGYYDRFLKDFMFKVGLALKENFVNELPHDSFDKNVDLIFVKEEKNVNKRYIKRFYYFRCWRRRWSCRKFK